MTSFILTGRTPIYVVAVAANDQILAAPIYFVQATSTPIPFTWVQSDFEPQARPRYVLPIRQLQDFSFAVQPLGNVPSVFIPDGRGYYFDNLPLPKRQTYLTIDSPLTKQIAITAQPYWADERPNAILTRKLSVDFTSAPITYAISIPLINNEWFSRLLPYRIDKSIGFEYAPRGNTPSPFVPVGWSEYPPNPRWLGPNHGITLEYQPLGNTPTTFVGMEWSRVFDQTQKPKTSWREVSFLTIPQLPTVFISMQWKQSFDEVKPPKYQNWPTWDAPLFPLIPGAATSAVPWGLSEHWQTQKPKKSWQEYAFSVMRQVPTQFISNNWQQAFEQTLPLKRQALLTIDNPQSPTVIINKPWGLDEFSRLQYKTINTTTYIDLPLTPATVIRYSWDAQFNQPNKVIRNIKEDNTLLAKAAATVYMEWSNAFNNIITKSRKYPSDNIQALRQPVALPNTQPFGFADFEQSWLQRKAPLRLAPEAFTFFSYSFFSPLVLLQLLASVRPNPVIMRASTTNYSIVLKGTRGMVVANQTQTVSAGDVFSLQFPILNTNGTPAVYTSPVAEFSLSFDAYPLNGATPLLLKSSSGSSATLNQQIINGALTWVFTVNFTRADTLYITSGKHYFEVYVIGDETVATGILTINPTITRP